MNEESADNGVSMRVGYPRWFVMSWLVCVALCVALALIVCIHYGRVAIGILRAVECGILVVVAGSGVALGAVICRSAEATESGIVFHDLLSGRRQIPWSEVAGLSRPAGGIPGDAAFVMLKDGSRVQLLRSMRGYAQLARLMARRYPSVSCDADIEEKPLSHAVSWPFICRALALAAVLWILRWLVS